MNLNPIKITKNSQNINIMFLGQLCFLYIGHLIKQQNCRYRYQREKHVHLHERKIVVGYENANLSHEVTPGVQLLIDRKGSSCTFVAPAAYIVEPAFHQRQ